LSPGLTQPLADHKGACWLGTSVGDTLATPGQRQRDGIAKAKREGHYKGRVPTARRQAVEIARLKQAGVRPSEIAVRLGIGRASVYQIARIGAEQ
jgi:DNA invertase Pin-like site-specific DNA recombinase